MAEKKLWVQLVGKNKIRIAHSQDDYVSDLKQKIKAVGYPVALQSVDFSELKLSLNNQELKDETKIEALNLQEDTIIIVEAPPQKQVPQQTPLDWLTFLLPIGMLHPLYMLAQGSSGTVMSANYLKSDGSRTRVALKITSIQNKTDLENEIQILQKISHCKHVHKLLYFGPDPDSIYFMLVTEPVGLSLDILMRRDGIFTIDQAVDVVSQILEALKCVHAFNIVHRDIKPGNIICGRYDQKYYLIDFGIACFVESKDNSTTVGTPYFSPAVFAQYPKYSFSDDIQSLIFTVVFLVLGFIPWHEDTLLFMTLSKSNFLTFHNQLFEATIKSYELDTTLFKSLLKNLIDYENSKKKIEN